MKKQLLTLTVLAMAAGTVFAQATDTLAKIKDRGTVNLGVRDSSGLAFTVGGGKYVGFHTEMAERIVDDLGKSLGKPLKINYQVITSQNRIPLIQNGTIDFECGLTLPLFRVALNPRFTRPFYAVPRTSAARTASG